MNRFLLFGVTYGAVSCVTFLTLFFVVPGFPFFPCDVYSATQENVQTELQKGTYVLCYYVKGTQGLEELNKNVGTAEIDTVSDHGEIVPIKLAPSNYLFDEAPGEDGIRGRTVFSFEIPYKQQVKIKSNYKRYGFDGLLIRTTLTKLLVSIGLFELFALILSLLVARLFWSKLLKPQPFHSPDSPRVSGQPPP